MTADPHIPVDASFGGVAEQEPDPAEIRAIADEVFRQGIRHARNWREVYPQRLDAAADEIDSLRTRLAATRKALTTAQKDASDYAALANAVRRQRPAELHAAKAEALREAADEVPTAYGDEADHWLRARAAAMEGKHD